ncbi:MAG TPA: alpha/beta fold hydrolase [Motilibacteraceae bacterium]|nr:alpha/beta fold hydrolase [Motilibacteraceae bacterium]
MPFVAPPEVEPELRTVVVHGHERAYVTAGQGPALLLLHGIGCDHRSWLPVLPALAEHFTVVAPDLLGHGASAKPRADYSLGGFANGMRDLLTLLHIERATVVGHSFGGGVAMQFAYQFPDRTERVVLVGSGGLGRSVNPLLRAATLPGSGPALAAATWPPVRTAVTAVADVATRAHLPWTGDLPAMTQVYRALGEPAARRAFLHVLRAAVDWRGQVVTMLDRAYLAEEMPVLVVWGRRDTVLPLKHARAAAAVIPGARIEVFDRSGHFPMLDEPERFADVVTDFTLTTRASRHDRRRWRDLLAAGRPERRRPLLEAARA